MVVRFILMAALYWLMEQKPPLKKSVDNVTLLSSEVLRAEAEKTYFALRAKGRIYANIPSMNGGVSLKIEYTTDDLDSGRVMMRAVANTVEIYRWLPAGWTLKQFVKALITLYKKASKLERPVKKTAKKIDKNKQK